ADARLALVVDGHLERPPRDRRDVHRGRLGPEGDDRQQEDEGGPGEQLPVPDERRELHSGDLRTATRARWASLRRTARPETAAATTTPRHAHARACGLITSGRR